MAYGFDEKNCKVNVEEKRLIWQNANPGQDFPAKRFTIPGLRDYECVEIETKTGNIFKFNIHALADDISNGGLMAIYINEPGAGGLVYFTQRSIRFDLYADGVIVGDCYCKLLTASNVTTTNSYLIPYAIYGLK